MPAPNIMLSLFRACLNHEYRNVENGGSFATDRVGDALYLWFEHSHGVTDWLNNLDFVAVPYRDMQPVWQCHAGFLKVWKSVKPYLEGEILDPTVKRLCIVGYSHGAALAVLCHEYAWYHRPDLRDRLCGFAYGCPRVLYDCVPPEIAVRWESFFNIQNQGDVVTHLPPRLTGFCHVGVEVLIGRDGKYSAIDAHRPESYLAELEENSVNRISLGVTQ